MNPLCFLLSCHFSPRLPIAKEGSQCASVQCSSIVFTRHANYTLSPSTGLACLTEYFQLFLCCHGVRNIHRQDFGQGLCANRERKHLKFICTWADVASVDISSASHLLLFEDSLSNNCIFPHSCTKTQQRNVCSFFVYFHFCSTSTYWLMVGCCCQDLWLEKTPLTRFPIRSYSRLWVLFFLGAFCLDFWKNYSAAALALQALGWLPLSAAVVVCFVLLG